MRSSEAPARRSVHSGGHIDGTLYLVQLYAGSRAWATADTRQTEMKRKTVMCRFD